jgi:Yip1-like protein
VNAAARAKAILVDPLAEWAVIEKETGDPAFLLSRYVVLLALVPAIASLVGACGIGVVVPGGGTVRASLFDGLFGAIFGYVLTCATVLLLAILIDFVAPLFGGQRDFDSACKLAVYSFTPVWLAGIFLLLPGLRFLTLTGCYGVYILWLGLPRLMKVPEERSHVFAIAAGLCAFALAYLAAVMQRAVFGTPGL